MLGEKGGSVEILDIDKCEIILSHYFGDIFNEFSDIVAIDDTHFLLALRNGLLKATKNQVIRRY